GASGGGRRAPRGEAERATTGPGAEREAEAEASGEPTGEKHRYQMKELRMQIHALTPAVKEEEQKERRLQTTLENVHEKESAVRQEIVQAKSGLQLLRRQEKTLAELAEANEAYLLERGSEGEKLAQQVEETKQRAKDIEVKVQCAQKYINKDYDHQGESATTSISTHSTELSSKRSATRASKLMVEDNNMLDLLHT
ncbi:unnamed protein product, partial [Effrenium voratum]